MLVAGWRQASCHTYIKSGKVAWKPLWKGNEFNWKHFGEFHQIFWQSVTIFWLTVKLYCNLWVIEFFHHTVCSVCLLTGQECLLNLNFKMSSSAENGLLIWKERKHELGCVHIDWLWIDLLITNSPKSLLWAKDIVVIRRKTHYFCKSDFFFFFRILK